MSSEISGTATKLNQYYRWHAPFYDITRWSFLFGRKTVLDWLEAEKPEHVTELGSGTGTNLFKLHNRLPGISLSGIELSESMVYQSSKRLEGLPNISIHHTAFSENLFTTKQDSFLCSYSFTMMGYSSEKFTDMLADQLESDGIVALVDFHHSNSLFFREWMGKNHVAFQPDIEKALSARFKTLKCEIRPAYLGLWHYIIYLGRLI